MTNLNQLAELHVREHEARLKHIDELLQQADESSAARKAKIDTELEALKQERGKLADYVEDLKRKSHDQMVQTAGPMVMWELVAERLEKLIEKINTE